MTTHKGHFWFNCLTFEVASALAILQKYMDIILQGIPITQCMLDDLTIAGEDEKEYSGLLEQVLQ